MSDRETAQLAEDLAHFQAEQEKVRQVIGQIGGAGHTKREKAITIASVIAVVALFGLDVCRHFLGIEVPLPPLFSLEVGVLLVSLKIIWMIHTQTKIGHFQFWILNSIEFRVNQIAKGLRDLEERHREHADGER